MLNWNSAIGCYGWFGINCSQLIILILDCSPWLRFGWFCWAFLFLPSFLFFFLFSLEFRMAHVILELSCWMEFELRVPLYYYISRGIKLLFCCSNWWQFMLFAVLKGISDGLSRGKKHEERNGETGDYSYRLNFISFSILLLLAI